MDSQLSAQLDPRGNWENLPKYRKDEKSEIIQIPDQRLKILCRQPCYVNMNKFNVLARISSAYEKECREEKKPLSEETRVKLFLERGMRVYNKFYKPRLGWFAKQQDFLRSLRQRTFLYYWRIKVELETDSRSLPDTEEFLTIMSSLPGDCQSSQTVDQAVDEEQPVSSAVTLCSTQEYLEDSLSGNTPEHHRHFIENLERNMSGSM